MEEPFSLSQAVKELLDTSAQRDERNGELKQIKKVQLDQEEKIKKEMLNQNLRVVRVLQHSAGPHDVQIQTKRRKLTQFTKNKLSEILTQHKDQTLSDDLSTQILSEMNEPEYKEEEKIVIKKLSKK